MNHKYVLREEKGYQQMLLLWAAKIGLEKISQNQNLFMFKKKNVFI